MLTDGTQEAPLTNSDLAERKTASLLADRVVSRDPVASRNTVNLESPTNRSSEPVQQRNHSSTSRHPHQTVSHHIWRRRVPVLTQMSNVECGAACLAMILSYYGHPTSISKIREQCGIDRDGLSARDIVMATRQHGMRVRAISLPENDFRFVSLPAIIHWEFNHFLIVERWSSQSVQVVDPALGRRRVTAEEFNAGFTGVVIMLEPGVHFAEHPSIPQRSLRTYIANYLKQAPKTFVQIIMASLLLQVFGLAVPLFTKIVIGQVIPFQMKNILPIIGVGMLILLASQGVTTRLRALLLIYLQARVDTQMMLGFFEHLLALPLRFFQQHSNGDILARLNSNTVIRDTLNNQLTSVLLDGSFVIVYLLILFWQSRLFGILVLAIALVQVLLLLSTKHALRELTIRELMNQGKSQGYVAEALTGMVTLKAAGAEHRALQHWSNLFFEQLNASLRRNILASFVDTLTTVLRTLSPLLLLWIGAIQVLNGTMQMGTMLALSALATAFLTPLASLLSNGQKLQLVHSHLERLADVLEAEPEQRVQSVQQPPRLTGSIRLEHVSFHYSPQTSNILCDICVQIEPGQRVAIVGRTGSGKSTLGKLLLGLHLPTEGEIFYDGFPLHSLNYQATRSQFGIVMQEATIFSGSIRQNIAFNDPEMDMKRVIQAAQAAALHDDVMQMPMRYETLVSEAGSALSGGQRQRLALARALAHAPALLLLDEATSSLDIVTEQIVERNIRNLACTQIVIAHRLSTIRNADTILVLDQGTIVERGTHQELLRQGGYYAKLIQSQADQ